MIDFSEEMKLSAQELYNKHTRWGDGLVHIPYHMRDGVVKYVLFGIKPGNFLSAVISNDLFGAMRRADDINLHNLNKYGVFFTNYAPSNSYGDPASLTEWCSIGGLLRRPMEEA